MQKQIVIFPLNSFLASVATWLRIFQSQRWCRLDPTLDEFFFYGFSHSLSESKETFGILVLTLQQPLYTSFQWIAIQGNFGGPDANSSEQRSMLTSTCTGCIWPTG